MKNIVIACVLSLFACGSSDDSDVGTTDQAIYEHGNCPNPPPAEPTTTHHICSGTCYVQSWAGPMESIGTCGNYTQSFQAIVNGVRGVLVVNGASKTNLADAYSSAQNACLGVYINTTLCFHTDAYGNTSNSVSVNCN